MDRSNSKYARLLGDPEVSIPTEFLDEAIMQWLRGNMGRFLSVNPKACSYFMKDKDHRSDVAEAISMEPEGREVLVGFVKSLEYDYYYKTPVKRIIPRLLEAGLGDLITNLDNRFFECNDIADLFVKKISPEALATIMGEKINWLNHDWHWDTMSEAIDLLGPKHLRVLIGKPFNRSSSVLPVAMRTISTLARKLPISDLKDFVATYIGRTSELTCMSCANTEIKSKPGYTLHRKKCDPNDDFPSIYLTVKHRMLGRM